MGNAEVSQLFFVYVEKLVWKVSFNHLEYGPGMFNVVSVAGMQYPHFEDKDRTLDHRKSLLFDTLFHWARMVYELYFFI